MGRIKTHKKRRSSGEITSRFPSYYFPVKNDPGESESSKDETTTSCCAVKNRIKMLPYTTGNVILFLATCLPQSQQEVIVNYNASIFHLKCHVKAFWASQNQKTTCKQHLNQV